VPKLEFIYAGLEEEEEVWVGTGAQQQNGHRRSVSLDVGYGQPAVTHGKRLSLPTLRLIWPEPADAPE